MIRRASDVEGPVVSAGKPADARRTWTSLLRLTLKWGLTAARARCLGQLFAVSYEHLSLLNHRTQGRKLTHVEKGTVTVASLHHHVELSMAVVGAALVHGGGDIAGRHDMDTCGVEH